MTRNLARTFVTRDLLLGVCVLIAFSACYLGVYGSLVAQWMTNDVYAHGFLIPFISAYILYERRAQIAAVPVEPHVVSGSITIIVGLCLLLIGFLGGIVSVSQLSLMITLTGTVLLLFGRRMIRRAWIPLGYLLFMIPIWDVATNEFQGSFQLISADIGAALLRTAGIPVRHDGVFLELPNVTLQVAEACSGVNFVVAILAVSIPQAYLMLTGIGLRVLVTIFAVIVALLTNGLRVAVIGVVAYWGLSGADIHGPGHILQGLSVAVVGFVVVFATIYLLAKRTGRSAHAVVETIETPRRDRISPSLAMGCCVLFLSVAALQASYRPEPVALSAPVSTFPAQIDSWRSVSTVTPPAVIRRAGADAELSRRYVGNAGKSVQFYIGYYTYQAQGKEIVTDAMRALHASASEVAIARSDGSSFLANEVASADGHYTLFWYDLDGRTLTGRIPAKAWTIWDSLLRRQSNGAVVMLTADTSSGDADAIRRDVRAFAGAAAVSLLQYLPQESTR